MGHDHHHYGAGASTRMGASVFLTLIFVAVEATCGVFGHSLALVSDAGHNFADAAALGFAWYAISVARKPSHEKMTFGYHRVAILAAMVNAVSLVVIALIIFWEAIGRLRQPDMPHANVMIIVAAAAVVMNLTIGAMLHNGTKWDINQRAAYLHMIGDAISALGVVIAGIVIIFTGWRMADPIVSMLIAFLIALTSWGILKESVGILLEATPAGMDMSAVEKSIGQVTGVLNVHDLHVWTLGPGAIAASMHILVNEQTIRTGQQILKAVVAKLDQDFHINHTTVQIEVEGHQSNDMYCSIDHEHEHHHESPA